MNKVKFVLAFILPMLVIMVITNSEVVAQGPGEGSGDTTTKLTYTDPEHGFAFIYSADMIYRKWDVNGEVGDVLASTSFFTATAEIDKSVQPEEISVGVLANPEKIPLLDWVALRSNPENWDTLPAGTTTYQIIGDVHKMTVAGREAVIFADNSFGVFTGRLLIADGERIISILYTDFGNAQMKSAFATVAASFQFQVSPSLAEPSIDTQLEKEINEIIDSYPSPQRKNLSDLSVSPQITYSGYKLPWTATVAHTVTQGWGGTVSHNCPGAMCYAYDFDLSWGEIVRASKDGTVAWSTGIFSDCGGRDLSNKGNRVVINHPDNTATLYLHLKNVWVSQGSSVSRGQIIGLAGYTGWTYCGTHLHFQRQSQGSWFENSMPVFFDEYPETFLQTGSSYTSQNWP